MAVPPERSLRSVFVGNIPYEASEEQLKEIFSDVGPVVSFRLVFDRDTGKPKGYGFCEYKDQETAVSAMRNLNNYELNGRTLRVDSAASEKNKEEEMIAAAPPETNPFGPAVPPSEAPSAITQAVASLPPEQMFELMKQMKLCIQNNPEEARQMLLQNPQLSYALLQAQVVMKIVNPEIAQAILYRQAEPPQPLQPEQPGGHLPPGHIPPHPDMRGGPPPDMRGPPDIRGQSDRRPPSDMRGDVRGPPLDRRDGRGPPDDRGPPPDRRGPRDMRGFDRPSDAGDPRRNPDFRGPADFRSQDRGGPDYRDPRGFDRGRSDDRRGPPETRSGPSDTRSGPPDPRSGPRSGPPDPRNTRGPDPGGRRDRPEERFSNPPPSWNKAGPPPAPPTSVPTSVPSAPTAQSSINPATGDVTSQDQEKAALIMQVLSLTDQQIALLPEDQRQSIMVLKEQIARSSQ